MTRPDLGGGGAFSGNALSSDRSGHALAKLKEEDQEERLLANENEEGLLAPSGAFGAEDEEADRIFAAVDAKMAERRKGKRKEPGDRARVEEASGATAAVFADLKRDLSRVSEGEWAALPEVGDFRAKRMKKATDKERYMPLPDAVIVGTVQGGTGYSSTAAADVVQFGEARERILGIRLDQLGGNTSPGTATSTIDKEGYLTSLGTESAYRSGLEVGDLRRARLMLQSAVQTNPGSSQAWISAARLEEVAMDIRKARELIRRACDACPESEDVWLEALRLLPKEQSVALMARALATVPASAKLWLRAAELEGDVSAKRRLLRRALERVPTASQLWMALIELEEEEADARALLGRAVECCPQSVALWLALARLEDHLGARQVINRARAACPKSREIWLAAARLEEAYGNTELVAKIVGRAVGELGLAREDWLKSAIELDAGGDTATAMAIVNATYGRSDEDPSVLAGECLEEAQTADAKGAKAVAQAFIGIALKASPQSADVWEKAIDMETRANADSDEMMFGRALEACPRSQSLWLKYAGNKQSKGQAEDAFNVLEQALSVLPDSEALWLAAFKLLQLQAANMDPVRSLLERARAAIPDSERLWRKSAELEISLQRHEEAKRLLVQGVAKFGKASPKLWVLLAKLEADSGNTAVARGVFQKGLEECPRAEMLWRQAALFEESLGPEGLSKARSLLEKGRAAVDSSDALWLASVQLEMRAGQPQMAKTLLAKALQTLPNSSILWAEAVALESRPLRKAKASAALNRLGHDAAIYLAIAKMMWADRKLEQTREYFERALAQDMANGDVWAWYITFAREQQGIDEASRLEALAFRNGPPRNGILWKPYRKANKARFHAAPQELFAAFMQTLPPI